MTNATNYSILKNIVLGAAIIITALVLGNAIKNRNAAQDKIAVVGLGAKDFISDEIAWSGTYSAKATNAKEAYTIINADREKVKAFFIKKGFTSNEIIFGGVNFSQSYRRIEVSKDGLVIKNEDIADGYIATQSVSFSSKKNPVLMKKIEEVINQTAELINSGIEFNAGYAQYTYSDLPSLKHNLIENATKDARERAEKIVKTANGDLAKLKEASMGVFQITGKGSVEEDSYGGNNDTYSKEKTARITVRLTYELD